ncbi:MAG TPA: transcription termination/antitermination NusG family protein [Candidatus Udaeobacter sp.]|nr:transcription termination/antitermination NusG family protein [Candidatus Udaeobacter sp.]
MTFSRAQLALIRTPLWFCLRAQPKREHLAAIGLRRQLNVPCYAPRLRYRKMTRRGAVWFVEAMFPGYLFAQFVYTDQNRRVGHSPGIQGIVQFGDDLATVDCGLITSLQQTSDAEEIVTIDPEIQVGQEVRITTGPFQGLEALVTRLIPAKERIRVLLSFLGRSVETEVALPQVLSLAPRKL